MNDRLLLLLLFGLNLLLKLVWHGPDALVHDEPFTVYWSQRPWHEFLAMLRGENNPPLHFLLIKVWSLMVPFEPAWLRLPSALFSSIAVIPLHRIAKQLLDSRTALVSALIFTFTNYHIGFAHEVRAYALLMLLAVTSMWLVVRRSDLAHAKDERNWPLALVLIAMVYTHFFGWLMIGLLFGAVLLVPALRPSRALVLSGTAMAAVAFAPYLLIMAGQAQKSITDGTWLEPPAWEELYNMIWRWSNAPLLAVSFLLLIALGSARSRMRSPLMQLAAIWALLPLVAMFLVSFSIPIFHDRYLVFAAPGFALLVGASISAARIPERFASALAWCVVVGMALTCTPWRKGPYDPRHTAEQAERWCKSDCHVEVVPAWYWLNYLAAKDINLLKQDQRALLASSPLLPDSAQAKALGTYILIDGSGTDASRPIREALIPRFSGLDSAEADHRVRVYRFTHPD